MFEQISEALEQATREQDALRRSTLRLVLAAVKDRQIQLRGEEGSDELDEAGLVELLGRMVKQRTEAAEAYDKGGRADLAKRERQEIEIIREFMPRQLSAEEQKEAVRQAIDETGAESIRDMGKVMAALKAAHTGRMDFAKASADVRASLN